MTPLVNLSPHHAATFDLFVNLLEHQLTETAYEAEAAELSYNLKALETGLEIKIYGFDHKLPVSSLYTFRPFTFYVLSKILLIVIQTSLKSGQCQKKKKKKEP